MFENLTEKLNLIFKRLRGHGKLSERHINEALREIRLSLLEADVNFRVVKDFIESVRLKALGQEVLESLTPAQQVIKIVKDELTSLMGGRESELDLKGKRPISIMLVGLQGCGKTTTIGKLAKFLQKKGLYPYLVPADTYRPAAILQVERLAQELNLLTHKPKERENPVNISKKALEFAINNKFDVVLIDTQGRWHIDEELMSELREIKETIHPQEILLVADAMTGQEAVSVATKFNEYLDLSGIILTKMDGDARGGASLSIKSVTQKPIKFIGTGEKLDALEIFRPEGMASRILGMGDVISLIERAEDLFDAKKAKELERKIKRDSFTLEDFLEQLRQLRKMGSIKELLSMVPGINLKGVEVDERELGKIEAIINSMTRKEREDYTILNGSRRQRIAKGSGTTVEDVNRFIKRYIQARKMIQTLNKGRLGRKRW